jgi:hypothetical protein
MVMIPNRNAKNKGYLDQKEKQKKMYPRKQYRSYKALSG